MVVVPHASAHAPATVEHPAALSHVAVQHPEAVHAVGAAAHVHVSHPPPTLHVLVQLAG
jgi:hypothetical protein